MKLMLVIFATLAVALATTTLNKSSGTTKSSKKVGETFKDWKLRNGKKYSDAKAEAAAEKTYNDNVAKIEKHNSDLKSTYKQSADSDADKTPEEVKKANKEANSNRESAYGNKASTEKLKSSAASTKKPLVKNFNETEAAKKQNLKAKMPSSLDYRSSMSPVKDIGSCLAADWAFAAIAVIEYWSFKNGSNKIFSDQYLIDCIGKGGCNAGNIQAAFDYAMTNGLPESSAYPYVGKAQKCKKKVASTYYLQNYCPFPSVNGDESLLKFLIVKYGPVISRINTLGNRFNSYSSGVFNAACDSAETANDNFMAVVGFGTDSSAGDYWILRGNWGTGFGENGYIRVARNKGNLCGVANIIIAVCPY